MMLLRDYMKSAKSVEKRKNCLFLLFPSFYHSVWKICNHICDCYGMWDQQQKYGSVLDYNLLATILLYFLVLFCWVPLVSDRNYSVLAHKIWIHVVHKYVQLYTCTPSQSLTHSMIGSILKLLECAGHSFVAASIL